jgi:hypothetical protein
MKRLAGMAALVLLGAWAQTFAADDPVPAAEAAAQSWLALIDSANYAQSWTTAAKHFRDSVPESQWESQAAAVRGPLGAVKSRRIAAARFARSLPGAPDGEYVVIQYATSFEHKAEATETVTPMKDADGQWHVTGYFIR